VKTLPHRSTLSDANARRPEHIFERVYRNLYGSYHGILSSDSRQKNEPKWLKRLQIIDSTTISLFSNLLFKGVGRHPKTGKKKGGIKVHSVIHANGGVPSDVRFTSAATHDSFMLTPSNFKAGYLLANLLIMLLKAGIKRQWSFPGLATISASCYSVTSILIHCWKIPRRTGAK